MLLRLSALSVSRVMSRDPVLRLLGCLMRGLRSTSPRLPPGLGITELRGVLTGLPELEPGVLMLPEMRHR